MGNLAPNILKTARPGKYADGGGLSLLIKSRDGSGQVKGSWSFRYTYQGRSFDMGLGSVQALSLAQARNERDRWRDLMTDRRHPVNPIEEKRRLAREAAQGPGGPVLEDVAEKAFESLKGTLKADGQAGRWFSPLRLHVLPELGNRAITEINQQDIVRVLEPLWKTKYPTAVKALGRLGIVLQHGAAMGLDVNQSAVLNARTLLGDPGHKTRHHPALPLDQVQRLYASLDPHVSVQRALMVYLLLGGGPRLKPVRLGRFDQISDDVWTIDAEDMKGRRGKSTGLRVPLTERLVELLAHGQQVENGGFLFPSPNRGSRPLRPVSDQAIENVMRDRQAKWNWSEPYRPHGLRASFRTWAEERDPTLYVIAETALGHKIGGTVERTYARSDHLDHRRKLMTAWERFVVGQDHAEG